MSIATNHDLRPVYSRKEERASKERSFENNFEPELAFQRVNSITGSQGEHITI